MSPRGLAENEFHVVKRDGASTSRPIDIPPRSGLAKAPANARKCSPGRFQFLSRVLRGEREREGGVGKKFVRSSKLAIVPISFRLTANHRLVRIGSGVGGGIGGWKNSLLEQILFIFFFQVFLNFSTWLIVVDSLKKG